MRRPATLLLFLPLLFLGRPAPAAAAGELRFASVLPRGGGLEVEVEGRGLDRQGAELAVWLGGAEQAVAAAPAGPDRLRFTLASPVSGLLAVGSRRQGAQAAVELGEDPSPFAGLSVYHVMVGYFRNGAAGNDDRVEGWRDPNWAGGDLQGVLEKVDYLAALGVGAVWLSPVFKARTSHGYDVLDYYACGDQFAVPDDREASHQLFRRLVAELHARGIRLILDLPLNHAHRAYDRERGDPRRRQPRFGPARQEAEKLCQSWGAEYGYWNAGHPPTRRFLIETALHYLVEEGVDGLRLDYVRGLEHELWAELYAAVKARKPEAWLLGECWIDGQGAEPNAAEIATYYAEEKGRQFDSLVDFPMQILATEAFARGGSLLSVEAWLERYPLQYGAAAQPAFFLDNHDLSRFLSWTADRRRLLAALAFLASLSDPLVVFYGSETGLANGSPKPGFTDAGRIAMPWDHLDPALLAEVSRTLAARKGHPALTHGARLPLRAEKDLLVFAKRHSRENALVAVNLADRPRRIELDPGTLLGDAGLEALLGPPPLRRNGKLIWELPALTTSIAVAAAPAPPAAAQERLQR